MRRSFHHRGFSLVLLLLLAASAACQDAPDAAPEAGYPVGGTILNSISGQPIPRALVVLNQQFAALTGSGGEFSFDNIPAGSYDLSVRRPGFEGFGHAGNDAFGGRGATPAPTPPPRHIQVGPGMAALTLAITPEAGIAGQVTLSTSDPADGIRVMLYRRHVENGHSSWTMAGLAQTRSDGSFRVVDLVPGAYMVYTEASIDRSAAALSASGTDWGYPAVYYPGVTDASSAGVLVLSPGQQAEADFTLTRQPFYPVTAAVRSDDPQTPAAFQIYDRGGRLTTLAARYDRRQGLVRAWVPNGSWILAARSFGRTGVWGRADFQVSGAAVSLAISLSPIPAIPVFIRTDFTSTASAQPVTQDPGLNLALQSAEPFGSAGFGGSIRRDPGSFASGSYSLEINSAGRFWVHTDAYPPAYISSITSGGVDLGSAPLTLLPGATPAPIEITLRNDSGSITGQLSGQAAAALSGGQPVWIDAIPLFSTTSSLPRGAVESTGQFTLRNLAPGSYLVVASGSQQDIDFHSPEALAAFTGKGQTVTVDPGGTASVQLSVLSSGSGQ